MAPRNRIIRPDKSKSKGDKGKSKGDKSGAGAGKGDVSGKKCFFCDKLGHVKADCRKLKAAIAAGTHDERGKPIRPPADLMDSLATLDPDDPDAG